MTYALLDSAAATSLCADSLVSKLGLVVDKTHAEIQTATGNCDPCHQETGCVNVQGVNETKSFVIPESYVVKQLADVSSHIPRQEVANTYPHLQNLKIPLLQSLRWCCVDCVIYHERDVREEQHYIYVARTSNNRVIVAWKLCRY